MSLMQPYVMTRCAFSSLLFLPFPSLPFSAEEPGNTSGLQKGSFRACHNRALHARLPGAVSIPARAAGTVGRKSSLTGPSPCCTAAARALLPPPPAGLGPEWALAPSVAATDQAVRPSPRPRGAPRRTWRGGPPQDGDRRCPAATATAAQMRQRAGGARPLARGRSGRNISRARRRQADWRARTGGSAPRAQSRQWASAVHAATARLALKLAPPSWSWERPRPVPLPLGGPRVGGEGKEAMGARR